MQIIRKILGTHFPQKTRLQQSYQELFGLGLNKHIMKV